MIQPLSISMRGPGQSWEIILTTTPGPMSELQGAPAFRPSSPDDLGGICLGGLYGFEEGRSGLWLLPSSPFPAWRRSLSRYRAPVSSMSFYPGDPLSAGGRICDRYARGERAGIPDTSSPDPQPSCSAALAVSERRPSVRGSFDSSLPALAGNPARNRGERQRPAYITKGYMVTKGYKGYHSN